MKRPLVFVLLLILILTDGFGSLFQPELPERPDLLMPPASSSLESACERGVAFVVRQLASADWLGQAEPLDLVPEDALMMFDIADASGAATSFAGSEFGTTLRTADWSDILDRLELNELFRRPLEDSAATLNALISHPVSAALGRRRAVLALLSPDMPLPPDSGTMQFWLEHLLLIGQLPKDNNPAELLALLHPERQQTIYYQGIALQLLELKGNRKVYAASVGGRLLLSLSLRPVRKAVDLFLHRLIRRQSSMAQNSDAGAVRGLAAGRDDFFLHLNLSRLSTLFSLPAVFKSLDLVHRMEGRTDRFSAVFHYIDGQPPATWVNTVPTVNRSLGNMPDALLVYLWTNWLPADFWRQSLPVKGDELTAADAWLQQKGGLGLDEVMGLLGREVSISIAGISTDGLLPVPKICLMAEAADQKKLSGFLKRMTSDLPVKRDPVAGIPVVSLLAANGLMQPSYAFADSQLILADSREQLVDILSATQPKLVQSPGFQAVNTGLNQPANAVLFVRPAELSEGLNALASWAGTMIAANDDTAGEKSKILVDQVISPLIDGMFTFEAAGLRSAAVPDGVAVEAALLRATEESQQAAYR